MRISWRMLLEGFAAAVFIAAGLLVMALVARVGFIGVGIVGALIWFVCVRIELNSDAPIDVVRSPDLFARMVRERQSRPSADKAALRLEKSTLARSLPFFRYLGMGLTVIGFGVFLVFQV